MPTKPGEPSRNPFTKLLVNLYDQSAFHWFLSVVFSPIYTVIGAFYRLLNAIWPIRFWQSWQNRPEPKFPLPLTPNDLPIKTEGCDTCGNYLGTLIGTYVDASKLQALLPPGTSLDPAHIHDGQHSLVMLFGYTENLHFAWWPFGGMNYLECGVAIPNVQIDDNIEYVCRFFYIPLLHLNRLYPVILGWLVGYRKVWSRFQTTENTYCITSLFTGKKILEAEFTPIVSQSPSQAVHWQELLEEPHLNPFGEDKLFLHFHWDWSGAELLPVDAKVTLHRDFPGIAAGTYHFQGLDTGRWNDGRAPVGAVRLTAPFELLLPFSLDRLRAHQLKINAGKQVAAK